jgi:hypothetical protein
MTSCQTSKARKNGAARSNVVTAGSLAQSGAAAKEKRARPVPPAAQKIRWRRALDRA